MKIILTAGGTGGHIYPALGVIEELKKDKNNQFLYIGTKDRMESTIVPSLDIKYESLEVYGLTRNIKRNIKNVKCIISSYKKAKKIISEFKPDYVIGFGGYVTYPVIMAAHKLKVKTAIHEQNKIPGKTNKLLSKYADITFISFRESKDYFKNKVVYSGNPCGQKAITIEAHDKTKIGFSKNKKLILIVMGSLGSEVINEKLKDFLSNYNDDNSEILFVTGKASYDDFKDVKVSSKVKVVPFYNELSGLMKVADLIISRAGASTISEILSLNLPSILIPSPYVANNHQYYNAKDLSDKGLSIMLEQENLTTITLKNAINECFANENKMKEKLKQVPKLEASRIIVDEIKK